MPRKSFPPSLRTACLTNVAKNMESLWCAEYYANFHEQGDFIHILTPLDCLSSDMLQELIDILGDKRLMKRYFLNCLIDNRLESLNLSNCRPVANKDSIMNLIVKRCQRLTRLNVCKCSQVSARVLSNVVQSLPCLVSLNLRHTKTSDQVLTTIGRTCPQLRELDINGCPVTDMGLMSLCVTFDPNQPKVERLFKLDIGCTAVTNKGVEIVITNLKFLQYLHYPDTCDVLYQMRERQRLAVESGGSDDLASLDQTYALRVLYETNMNGHTSPVDESIRISSLCCPLVTEVHLHRSISDAALLHLTCLRHLQVLQVANSDEELVTFEGGLFPLLQVVGGGMRELALHDINSLDIGAIGCCCPNLAKFTCLIAGFPIALFPAYTHPELHGTDLAGSNLPFAKLECLKLLLHTEKNTLSRHSLEILMENALCLKSLQLAFVMEFNDDFLLSLMDKNPLSAIEEVWLEGLSDITAEALFTLINRDNNLEHLSMLRCAQITRGDSQRFKKHMEKHRLEMSMEWG